MKPRSAARNSRSKRCNLSHVTAPVRIGALFATMMKWQTKFILRLFFLLFPLLISLPAEATVVTLQNGDQLSGEVVSETEREITLHHSVLGVLKIPKKPTP